MSEAPSGRSPSGRGRGGRGGNPSRGGRGNKGNSSRSKRSSGAKEGSAAPSNKATSNVNNDSKAAIEQAVTPKKVVDPVEERVRQMSDQDALVAFGPFIRSGDQNAVLIHKQYLANNNQSEFINNVRQFLIVGQERNNKPNQNTIITNIALNNISDNGGAKSIIVPVEVRTVTEIEAGHTTITTNNSTQQPHNPPQKIMLQPNLPTVPPGLRNQSTSAAVSTSTQTLPPGLLSPSQQLQGGIQNINDYYVLNSINPMPLGMVQNNTNVLSSVPTPLGGMSQGIIGLPPQSNSAVVSPIIKRPPGMPPPMRPVGAPVVTNEANTMPSSSLPKPPTTSSILPARTPLPTTPLPSKKDSSKMEPDSPALMKTPAKSTKQWRTQTRSEEQPGRLFAITKNNDSAAIVSSSNQPTSITARTRSELTARWVLPLPYLRDRAIRRFEEQENDCAENENSGLPRPSPQNLTIRDALKTLTVGLFRRGAMDNGASSSIVSKVILCSDSNEGPNEDYFFNIDQKTDVVFGTVPFYAPRTPGNVVFRLYFEDEPHVTLACGPCIGVIPSADDYESVLRFILSNFKAKKTNGMSSINALTTVFEMFSPHRSNPKFSYPGRMAWGCVCEARKVVEQAAQTYVNKKEEIEERLEAIKIKDELPDLKSLNVSGELNFAVDDSFCGDTKREGEEEDSDAKTGAIMKDKFANERKWTEVQHAYASCLKAVLSNKDIHLILKRELLSTIRLEYELWCPLCEAFAPNPFVETNFEASKMPGNVSAFPYPAGKEHFQMCRSSREEMQQRVLGFVPNLDGIGELTKGGTNFFLDLSSAMNEMYTNEYAVSEKVWRRREQVRAAIEQVVSRSGEFPPGTKVAVFGSSANGFGSPNSDLDLCLCIPASAADFAKDGKGVEAMTNLASKFTDAGMRDVNTERLTARIPIVKFDVPYNDKGKEIFVECDLSLQNPLALLNTSLLRTYATISPMTCVLASIIKRWAKSRDINNPSKHTLSSYGYVLMLIYFLKNARQSDGKPILPNLQWLDPLWAQNTSTPYREIAAKPKSPQTLVEHPTLENYVVNSYFYRTGLEGLQKYCADKNDPSTIGILLASFFHYFAYTFDYKKNVVSLGNTIVEKEVKAEEDGWSVYKQGLAIEDPFELFYDVAHVVKSNNFLHIKKEFALAYSKIANEAQSKKDGITGKELIDLICEPVNRDESSD